jgi:hypothetical protein
MAPEGPDIGRTRDERIPVAHLPVDLIHRAVVRMKEVMLKILQRHLTSLLLICRSGDRYRLFDTQMSPLAECWTGFHLLIKFSLS